jgi:hypothetical protein
MALLPVSMISALLLLPGDSKACAATTANAPVLSIAPYEPYVQESAQRFAVPAAWIRAVIAVESAGNATAVSPKGAMGLMQLMPGTWSALRAQYQLGGNPFDPHDNVLAGTAYLRQMLDRFGRIGFLAAYNAGPTRFDAYLAGRQSLSGETKRYLAMLARLLPDLPINDITKNSGTTIARHAASLFVGRMTARSTLHDATDDDNGNNRPTAPAFALAPQPTGLLVPVSAAGER